MSATEAGLVSPGLVSLVGAGPGDPELLTIKALRALQRADVVLHDFLVSDEVLDLARVLGPGVLPAFFKVALERPEAITQKFDVGVGGFADIHTQLGRPLPFQRPPDGIFADRDLAEMHGLGRHGQTLSNTKGRGRATMPALRPFFF